MQWVLCGCLLTGISFYSVSSQSTFTPADAIEVVSLSSTALSHDGDYVAGITYKGLRNRFEVNHFRFRDPSYVRPFRGQLMLYNTSDGSGEPIGEPGHVTSPVWSPDNSRLAFFRHIDGAFRVQIYDVANGTLRTLPADPDLNLVGSGSLQWFPDGKSLLLESRASDWLEKGMAMYREATEGPITVYDAEEPFLKWDAIANQERKTQVMQVQVADGEARLILPEGIYQDLTLDDAGDFLVYQVRDPQKTSYDRRTGTRYAWLRQSLTQDVTPQVLVDTSDRSRDLEWTEDRDWFAWSDSGHVFIQSIDSREPLKLTDGKNELIEDGDTTEIKFSVDQWNRAGTQLIARSTEGLWRLDRESGEVERFIVFPEAEERTANLRTVAWHPDGRYLYLTYSATKAWRRGLIRYDFDTGEQDELIVDKNLYRRWALSKDGSQFIYFFSDGNRPGNLFTATADFAQRQQLTDLNPWITEKKMTRTELVSYLDADGEELFGILYYPVDYDSTQTYPLVCEVYEDFFDNGYRSSMNIMANAGYFGFRPSVRLEEGRPGEAWIKGVTAGVNKLIERGLVDPDKIGVHGVSYGGYATSLLIAQTDRFAAAINISGKTNVISFLGDSPRIGTRNYAAAEVGQDRLGETLWEAPMNYIDHSAIFFADEMNTPHLLLTGAGDWNVPAANTRELYYALRRLGKKVVWVDYQRAGHGAGWAGTEDDYHDQWKRILDWYATHFTQEEAKK